MEDTNQMNSVRMGGGEFSLFREITTTLIIIPMNVDATNRKTFY
jgi:hypothetical protein